MGAARDRRRRDRDDGDGHGRLASGRDRILRVRDRVGQPARPDRLHGHLDQHRARRTGCPMKAGDEFELKVTPDRYLTVRYAGASGDFNPIHIDEEFAQQVGLPGRILHGLWTMAQVARAHTESFGGPDRLARLAVQFRGLGMLEHEIVVHGTVLSVADDARGRQLGGRAGRQADRPQRVGRHQARLTARAPLGHRVPRPRRRCNRPRRRRKRPGDRPAPTYNQLDAYRSSGAGPAQARRGVPRRRLARRLQGAQRRRSSGARRRSATSSQASRSSGCSRTRTRRPGGSRPRPATATSSTGCCPPSSRAGRCRCRSSGASSTRRCGSRPRRCRRSPICWRS